jgi:hypothetical protein
MTDFLLEMEWHVCEGGYDIAPAPKTSGYPEMLIGKGKGVRVYKPFQKYDTLYSAFGQLKTADDLLKFINRFGPLGSTDNLNIEDLLRDAKAFRELLIAKEKSNKRVCSVFKSQRALVEVAWYKKHHPSVSIDLNKMVEADFTQTIGTISLVSDPKEGVRLSIEPYSLIHGLWVQLARKLSGQTIIRTCRHCGSIFEAGRGSTRRSDATFCCTKHSVRYHSLKRSRGG